MSFLQRLGGQLSKWQRALANVGDLTPPGNEFLLKLGAKHLQWELADDRMFGGLSEGAISLGEEESIRFSGGTSLELSGLLCKAQMSSSDSESLSSAME